MKEREATISPGSQASPRQSWPAELGEIARTLAAGLIGAAALQAALFQPFTIPSSSMEPGLVTGDYLVVSKFAYGWSVASLPLAGSIPQGRLFGRDPARGDVVVFRLPRDPGQVWIKRVIGLPGDHIQVRGGVVMLNGQALDQTTLGPMPNHDAPAQIVTPTQERLANGRAYLTYDRGSGFPGDDTAGLVVPAGFYFMMGDNRDNSLDSRWPGDIGVGLLPAQNILGRAEVVVASWRPGAALYKPWTWPNLRPGRIWERIA